MQRIVVGYLWVHINSDWKLSVCLYVIVSSTPLFSCRLQRPRDEHAGAFAYATVGSDNSSGSLVMHRQWPCRLVASMSESLQIDRACLNSQPQTERLKKHTQMNEIWKKEVPEEKHGDDEGEGLRCHPWEEERAVCLNQRRTNHLQVPKLLPCCLYSELQKN